MTFTLHAADGLARVGTLSTAHGLVETPAFMPVGTLGTVKALTPEAVKSTGAGMILGNTYHLMLRPGAERVARLGGLHAFMHWDGPILTDSGGFQVMSLGALCRLKEEGATFQSHLDGSRWELTPERSVEIQHLLDSDVTMVLDECTPFPATHEVAKASMERSMRWAARCREAFVRRDGYHLFGIVQGSTYADLREASVKALTGIGFDGYAVGGLAVGEGQKAMFETLDITCPFLPETHPRYLMGVGKPDDILGGIARGIDMFDCVIPTRSGRFGRAYTRHGEINLKNARHLDDPRPLDAGCACPACTHYGRAYLHHLVRAGEMLAAVLLSWHNIQYYQDLTRGAREAIRSGTYVDYTAHCTEGWQRGDLAPL